MQPMIPTQAPAENAAEHAALQAVPQSGAGRGGGGAHMQPRRYELSAPGGTPSRKRACKLAPPDLAASTLLSASVPLSS